MPNCQPWLPTKGTEPQRAMSPSRLTTPPGSSVALIPSFSFPQEYLLSIQTEEQVSVVQTFPSAGPLRKAALAWPLTSQGGGGDALAGATPGWRWRGWGLHGFATC